MEFEPFVVVVGFTGRMSALVRQILEERGTAFRVYSSKAPENYRVQDFKNALGVIDFSLPHATDDILAKALKTKVPLVCGTTGFTDRTDAEKKFREAGREIPILWDSNFSLGVEILCQLSELAAKKLEIPVTITDIHHIHKKDSPSGTALKIQDRILRASRVTTSIKSIREGEVFGEHRVTLSLQDESLELVHKAHSRRPFAAGAIRALEWTAKQKPGFYTMKDLLK